MTAMRADGSRVLGFVPVLLGSAALWLAASAVGSLSQDITGGLAAVYLPVAVATALLVRLRHRWWAVGTGVVLGAVVLALLLSGSVLAALLNGTVNALEAAITAWLLIRLGGTAFVRLRDAAALLLAGVVGVACGAAGGAVVEAWLSDADALTTL